MSHNDDIRQLVDLMLVHFRSNEEYLELQQDNGNYKKAICVDQDRRSVSEILKVIVRCWPDVLEAVRADCYPLHMALIRATPTVDEETIRLSVLPAHVDLVRDNLPYLKQVSERLFPDTTVDFCVVERCAFE